MYTSNNLKFFKFFIKDIVKWLPVLVKKSKNFVNYFSKFSIFYSVVYNCDSPVSEGRPTIKIRCFVEINLLKLLVIKNCSQLHGTKILPEVFIRHKFLKDEFSKSNQRQSRRSQKVGTKKQSEIWSRFVENRTTILSLFVVIHKFTQINIISLISQLSCTLSFSICTLE